MLRIKLSSGAMCVWGAKLAGFLFFRALKVNHDTRLDDTLSSVGGIGEWMSSSFFLLGVVCIAGRRLQFPSCSRFHTVS